LMLYLDIFCSGVVVVLLLVTRIFTFSVINSTLLGGWCHMQASCAVRAHACTAWRWTLVPH